MKSFIIRIFKWIAKRILLIADRDFLVKISRRLSRLNLWIEARLRRLDADEQKEYPLTNGVLRKFILSHDAPWLDTKIRDSRIPGIISEKEKNIIHGLVNFIQGGTLSGLKHE